MRKKAAYFFLIALLLLVSGSVYLLNPFKKEPKSGLQVITNNGAASLFLNDQYLDKTPYINKDIVPGKYSLRIVPDDENLAEYETPVELNPGVLTVVTWNPGPTIEASSGVIYELIKLDSAKKSEVAIISNPDGALIKFDNQDQEFTPLLLPSVEPGLHEYQASLPAYDSHKHSVNVVKGYRLNINLKLAKTQQAISPNEASSVNNEEQTATSSAQAVEATASADQDESGRGQTELEAEQKQITINPTNFFQEDTEVLRVRNEPSVQGEEVGYVQTGQTYSFLTQENNWYQLEFTDAVDGEVKTGWVSGEFVRLAE